MTSITSLEMPVGPEGLAHLQQQIDLCMATLNRVAQHYAAESALDASLVVSTPTVPESAAQLSQVDSDEATLQGLTTTLSSAIDAVVPHNWLPSAASPTLDDAADAVVDVLNTPQAAALCATGYGVLAQLLRMQRALVAHFGVSVASEPAATPPSAAPANEAQPLPEVDAVMPQQRSRAHHSVTAQLQVLRDREDECFDNALALERGAMLVASGVFMPPDASPLAVPRSANANETTTTTATTKTSSFGTSGNVSDNNITATNAATVVEAGPGMMHNSHTTSDTAPIPLSHSSSLTTAASATTTITSDEQLLKLSLRRGEHAAERGDGATAAEDFALLHSLLFHKLLLVEELIGYALASADVTDPAPSQASDDASAPAVADSLATATTAAGAEVVADFTPGEHFMLPPGLDDDDYTEERLFHAQREQEQQQQQLPRQDTTTSSPTDVPETVARQREQVLVCLRQLLAKVHADALPLRTLQERFRLLLATAIQDGRATIGMRESSMLLAAPSSSSSAARNMESLMPSMQGGVSRTTSQYASRASSDAVLAMSTTGGAAAANPSTSHFSLTVLLGQIAWNTAYCEWIEGDVPQSRDWLLAINLPKLVRRTRTAMHQYTIELDKAAKTRRAIASAGGGAANLSGTNWIGAAAQRLIDQNVGYQEDPEATRLTVPTISWERIMEGRAMFTPPRSTEADTTTTADGTGDASAAPCETAAALLLDTSLSLLQRASTLLAVCDLLIACRSCDDVVHLTHTLSWVLTRQARRASTSASVASPNADATAEALLLLSHCIEHLLSKRACKLFFERCAVKEHQRRESKLHWGSRTDLHAAMNMMQEDPRFSSSLDDPEVFTNASGGGGPPSSSAAGGANEYVSDSSSFSSSDSESSSENSYGAGGSSSSTQTHVSTADATTAAATASRPAPRIHGSEAGLYGGGGVSHSTHPATVLPTTAAGQVMPPGQPKKQQQQRQRRRHRRPLATAEYKALEEESVRAACDELVFAFTGGALTTWADLEAHGVPFPSAESKGQDAAGTSVLRPGLSTTLAVNALSSVLNFGALFQTSPHYRALRSSTHRAYRRERRRVYRGGAPSRHGAQHARARQEEVNVDVHVEDPDGSGLLLEYVEATYAGTTAREKVQRYRGGGGVAREGERGLANTGRGRGGGASATSTATSAASSAAAVSDRDRSVGSTNNNNSTSSSGGGGWFDMVRDAAAGFFATVVPPSPSPVSSSARTRNATPGAAANAAQSTAATAATTTTTRTTPTAPPVKAPYAALRLPSCRYTTGGVSLFPYECTERLRTNDTTTPTTTMLPNSFSNVGSGDNRSMPAPGTVAEQTEAEAEIERDECCLRVLTLLQRYRVLATGLTVATAPSLPFSAVSSVATNPGGASVSSRENASGAPSGSSACPESALIPLDESLLTFISQELNKAVHLLPTAVRKLGQTTLSSSSSTSPPPPPSPNAPEAEKTAAAMVEQRLAELQRLYVHALADARDADQRRRHGIGRTPQGRMAAPHGHAHGHRYSHRARDSRTSTAAAASGAGAARGRHGDLLDGWKKRGSCLAPLPARALIDAVTFNGEAQEDEQAEANRPNSERDQDKRKTNPPLSSSSTSAAPVPLSFAFIVASDVRDTSENRGEAAAVPVLLPSGTIRRENLIAAAEDEALPVTPTADAGDAPTTDGLGSLWWGKPLAVPRRDELVKKQAAQRSRPDPRRTSPRKGVDAFDASSAHPSPPHSEAGGADPAALLAFAAPPVFLPEITIDFSGFTTSSVQVQHATRQMVTELQEKQAAAEAAATTPEEKANVAGVSMLPPSCRLLLHNELPMLQQYTNWRLIYSTRFHGMSMQTILRCCRKELDEFRWRSAGGLPSWQKSAQAPALPGPPMLLVMELPPSTTFGFSADDVGVRAVSAAQRNPNLVAPPPSSMHRMLIGAYLSDMLCDDSRRYYGTSDTFVFQILLPPPPPPSGGPGQAPSSKPKLRAYHGCDGENTHFINVRHAPDSIVIGGGGGGSSLYIDDTLAHGATSNCASFHSPPLTEWLANGSPIADGGAGADFVNAYGSRSFDVIQLEVIVMDN